MNIKETRYITSGELRSLCIEKNWYTKGTNEQYYNLFKMLNNGNFESKNLTKKDLYNIANDIKKHSDTYYEITDIMFELADISTTCFEIVEV